MKRPLCTAAAAWMLGELCADNMKYRTVIFFAALFTAAVSFFILKDRREFFLLAGITFVFSAAGMCRMTEFQQRYAACEEIPSGEPLFAEGKVENIDEMKNGYKVTICVRRLIHGQTQTVSAEKIRVQAVFEEKPAVKTGNGITVAGEKADFLTSRNPGTFDEKAYCRSQGIALKIYGREYEVTDSHYSELRERLSQAGDLLCANIDKTCGEKEASVLKAILFGEKSGLDTEIKELYVKNGIAHILAVSGLHMSIVGMGTYRLLRRRFSFLNSGIAAGMLIGAFGLMTGFGISVRRALYMMLLRMGADLAGRKYDFKNAVCFSILLILPGNPCALYQASFLLSYSAMLTIGFVYPEFEAWFWPEKKKGKKSCCTSCAKSCFSGTLMWQMNLPVISYFYFEIPTYSVFLNFIVIPFMSVLFLSGMAASLAMLFSVRAGIFLSGAAVYTVKLYTCLCECLDRLPLAYIVTGRPGERRILLFYLILFVCAAVMRYYKRRTRNRNLFLVLLLLLQISVIYCDFREDSLEVSMIDVGQGDCILVENDNGHTCLIDGGSSSVSQAARYQIVPYLKYRGVGALDYVFISHGDSDHINGIVDILEQEWMKIGCILLPDCSQYEENYRELKKLAEKSGTLVRYLGEGQHIYDGSLQFEIVSPGKQEYQDINDASMVMRMSYYEFSMYFTGDIGTQTEKKILSHIREADVIKVPHHGSKESSYAEFIKKVQAEWGLVSCGVNNRYGHPHKETEEQYKEADTSLLVTADRGCIRIHVPAEARGSRYQISTFISQESAYYEKY